jgi:hypothetical protein
MEFVINAVISFVSFMAIMAVVVIGIVVYQHHSHMRGHDHDDEI